MSFSFPLFTAAAAAAIVLLAGFVYLIIYYTRINRALRSGEARRMAAPRTVLGIAAVIVFAGAVFVSYLAGYKAAYDDFEGSLSSSPAVEVPPMTIRDLSELPGLFDAALAHAEADGADLTDARASLNDLSFLDGGFTYLDFTLYHGSDAGRVVRRVEVNAAGAVFTEWHAAAPDEPGSSVPLETMRELIAALDAVDWPESGESQSFISMFGVVDAQSPGGYALADGALGPSTDAAGEYLAVDYVSGSEFIRIFVPVE